MPKVNAPMWNGRKIVKEEDAHDLEQRSALYEFKHRMARADAEHRAHHEYTKDKHREAAGTTATVRLPIPAAGSQEEGHKHGLLYQLHMKKLGLDPMDAVPHEIQSLADKQDKFYKFKAHRGDVFLLQGDDEGEVKKSELAKGDVVKFPGNPAPAVDQGKKAKVTRITPETRIFPHAQAAAAQVDLSPKKDPKVAQIQGPPHGIKDGHEVTKHVGSVLAGECGARALDDGEDYEATRDALARHFGVHPNVIHQELRNHTSRAMDDNEDLGHVTIEMSRHLTRHFGLKYPRKK